MYSVRCVVVDNASGDLVLGLPFRRRYDTALPFAFKPRQGPDHGQGLEVTHVCLGVPEGYGVSFPSRKLAERFEPKRPAEVSFKQVLPVKPTWQNWRQPGKELSTEELRAQLSSPSF